MKVKTRMELKIPKKVIEETAEMLHEWYLEATKELDPKNYNPKAQKAYKDLTEEQKFIDRFIAKKVIENVFSLTAYGFSKAFDNLVAEGRIVVKNEKTA